MEYRLTHAIHYKDHTKLIIIAILCFVSVTLSLFYVSKPRSFAFADTSHASYGEKILARAGIPTKVSIGPGVNQLLEDLKSEGLTADVIGNNTRNFFSVEGKIVALSHTNIKVFEYDDTQKLEAELESFKESANKPDSWKKNVNLYANDRVIVFYMGNQKEVKDALQNIFEK